MAEFCSECDPIGRDYDLVKESLKLKLGYSFTFFCEGCDIKGVYKDEQGFIYVARKINGEIELKPTQIKDLK